MLNKCENQIIEQNSTVMLSSKCEHTFKIWNSLSLHNMLCRGTVKQKLLIIELSRESQAPDDWLKSCFSLSGSTISDPGQFFTIQYFTT